MTLGILGGGLTGLTLADRCGKGCEVLEGDAVCGGLCRTVARGGFRHDHGGHILFSRDREALDYMLDALAGNLVRYRRNNRIWFKGRFVKYPFENDLAALPKEDVYDCLYRFLTRDYPDPANFRDWCYYRFGKGIAERYLIPYNEKIWNIDPARLGLEWVAGRIPEPPLEDVLKSALGIETEGYTHQLNFHYPRQGGIEALVRAIEGRVERVEKGFRVTRVVRRDGSWVVSDGRREKVFDRLASTIPLPDLLDAMDDVPGSVREAARLLRWNSLICVMNGFRSEKPSDKFAVYFPQPHLKFHRVCFYDYFGGCCTPPGMSSAVAEITVNEGDGTFEMTDDALVEHVASGLEGEGFLRRGDVAATGVSRRNYAYVVNDLGYAENLGVVRGFVRERGIVLCGRFAEWEYLNMDACVRHAMDCAAALQGGGQ